MFIRYQYVQIIDKKWLDQLETLEGLREARQRPPMLLDLGGQPSERNETHLREAQVLLSRRPDYQAKHHPL